MPVFGARRLGKDESAVLPNCYVGRMRNPLPFLFLAGALVAADPNTISEKYREPSRKLIEAALDSRDGLQRLQYLCDRIGNRLSGSASLERAVEWSAAEMRKAG